MIILGRADVDKALTTIPEQLRGANAAETSEKIGGLSLHNSVKRDQTFENNVDAGEAANDDSDTPKKKAKVEGNYTNGTTMN